MAVTVSEIITNMNTYVGDASTDRISAAERLQYVTEAVLWLASELKNDHQRKTYTFDFIDTVNEYLVSTSLADLLQGSELRRVVGATNPSMSQKSSRELHEEVSGGLSEGDSWSIERKNGNVYLILNLPAKNKALSLDDFDSSSSATNWVPDTTNSDALNVTQDKIRFKSGTSSVNFDVDVSQSGNDRATLENTALSFDLTTYDVSGVFLLDVDIPDATNVSSYTLYWGNDNSTYFSTSVTTNIDGSALANGWNTLAFEWAVATETGTVDVSAIDYFRLDINYNGSQADDTDFRIDNFRIANTEELEFHYISFNVGTDTTGATDRTAFTATTDIPYFSGQFDGYKYPVAHMAASIAFDNLRLKNEAIVEENRARKALRLARNTFPSSASSEIKTFKVGGINFNK